MAVKTILRRLGLEAAVWCSVSGVFLYVYVHHFLVSASAVLPHLVIMGFVFMGWSLVRLALCELALPARAFTLLTAIVSSLLITTILLYYGLVLVGLNTWGRVISWDLITNYAQQLPQLLDALSSSLPPFLGIFGVWIFGITVVMYLYYRRFDWVPFFEETITSCLRRIVYLTVASFFLVVSVSYFSTNPSTVRHEPISLTLYPDDQNIDFEGHALDPLSVQKFDREQQAVRTAYHPNPRARRKNLILIVVDALRPDHLSINGYRRETTPHLQKVVDTGMARYIHGIRASCGDSACGHLSLFSSRFPEQFSLNPFTLQQVLRRHGYKIDAVLAGDHTHFYGLRRFYGTNDIYFDGSMAHEHYMNDDQVALDKLATLPEWSGMPTMIQFHVMSAHILSKHESGPYLPAQNYFARISLNPIEEVNVPLDPAVINYYDNGVFKADRVISEILKTLEAKKYLKDSLVVITADHGESLGEHGFYGHANSVHREVLRIPLIFIRYGYSVPQEFVHTNIASQVDIAPTVLTEFQMPIPASWSGRPLQSPMREEFTYFEEQGCVGLFDQRDPVHPWKYWMDGRSGDEFAFDVTSDPTEQINLITSVDPSIRRLWRSKVLTGTYLTASR